MKKHSVLIVDDDEQFRLSLSKIFKKVGYRVTTATNGIEALKILLKLQHELVIADHRLPGMTGIELLKEIKFKSPKTKVLVITAYGDDSVRTQAINVGAFAFLNKPIKRNEILEWASKALNKNYIC